jgi:hypothetical protein
MFNPACGSVDTFLLVRKCLLYPISQKGKQYPVSLNLGLTIQQMRGSGMKKKMIICLFIATGSVGFGMSNAHAEAPATTVQEPEPAFTESAVVWGKQIGTPKGEFIHGVTVDKADNVYVVGTTAGAIIGENLGGSDIFFIKYTTDGEEVYRHQFGSKADDQAEYIYRDADNNIIITGSTAGIMGAEQFGGKDAFVAKFSPEGEQLWITQYGSDLDDQGSCIVIDKKNNLYISGGTFGKMGKANLGDQDGFITKMTADGEIIWTTQFGTPEREYGRGLCIDRKNNILAVSSFYLSEISSIACLSQDGDTVKQKDTPDILMLGILVNPQDEIYISGHSRGISMFAKLDENLDTLWTKTFKYGEWSGEKEIKPLPGNLYVTGGCMHWPSCCGFVRVYDGDGELKNWVKIKKTDDASDSTCGHYLAVDSKGAIYHVGGTNEDLYGPNMGENDGFLCKIEL